MTDGRAKRETTPDQPFPSVVDDPRPEELPPEELAEEIRDASAEGIPAHPETDVRSIGLVVALLAMVVLLTGLVSAIVLDPLVGVGIAVLGLVLLVANPGVWVGVLRAREREKARRRVATRQQASRR